MVPHDTQQSISSGTGRGWREDVSNQREYAAGVLNTGVILNLTNGGLIGWYLSLKNWDYWQNSNRAWALDHIRNS